MRPKTKNVYIDGINFLYGLKSIKPKYNDFNFDFEKFVEKLVDKTEIGQIYYYTAQFHLEKNPAMYYKQQRFFKRLKKQQFLVRVSRISEISNHVKGDDIYLAVDMMDDTCQKKFDTAILVSGDGDFVPLVKRVKSAGKNVELWYFEKGTSHRLKSACNEKRKINRTLIHRCGYSSNK